MDVNILSKLINIPLFVDSCAFTYSPRVSSNDRIPGPSDYELIAILYCSNLENIDNSSKIMQSSKIESLKSKLESASFIKKREPDIDLSQKEEVFIANIFNKGSLINGLYLIHDNKILLWMYTM